MKSRISYTAMVAVMACGMTWAQSGQSSTQTGSGAAAQSNSKADQQDLPAAREGDKETGKPNNTNPDSTRPGAMGAPETPNSGTAPRGETPATGPQTGEKGSATDNGSLPATGQGDASTNAPNASSETQEKKVPSYEKPITSGSEPSQK
jgi:hypothetical protein